MARDQGPRRDCAREIQQTRVGGAARTQFTDKLPNVTVARAQSAADNDQHRVKRWPQSTTQ
jgi:hypothetical protein